MALPIRYNIRNLRQRWKVTLLAIFGIALVVAAVVVIASMSARLPGGAALDGIRQQRHRDAARLMSELTSWINIGNAQTIMTDPRIARDSSGTPLASCEIVVIASKPKKSDNQADQHHLRGVTPGGLQGAQRHQAGRGTHVLARALRGHRRQEDL